MGVQDASTLPIGPTAENDDGDEDSEQEEVNEQGTARKFTEKVLSLPNGEKQY